VPQGEPVESERIHGQPEAACRKAGGGRKAVTADTHDKKPQGGRSSAEGSAPARMNARFKASGQPGKREAAPTQKLQRGRPDSSGKTPRSRRTSVARAIIKLSGGV
jgi:hypothetical protein